MSDDEELMMNEFGHQNEALEGDVSQFDLGSPMVDDPSPPADDHLPPMDDPLPPENDLGGRDLGPSPPAAAAAVQVPDSPVLGRPMGTQHSRLTRLRPEQPR